MPQHLEYPAHATIAAAAKIQHLDPGAVADLRRMETGKCAPFFWRLVAQHPKTIGRPDQEETWMTIIRILAILTPKGDPGRRTPLHDPKRHLGEVLCDGGNPGWTGPKPVFSEYRLMKLMAARGSQRAVLLTRAARAIARSMLPGSGVNVPGFAYVLLSPDNGRQLAEPYYRRLDWAEAQQSE